MATQGRRMFQQLARKKYQAVFNKLSLAELQLLLLGVWITGEQNRVDRKLLRQWKTLKEQLRIAAETKVMELAKTEER